MTFYLFQLPPPPLLSPTFSSPVHAESDSRTRHFRGKRGGGSKHNSGMRKARTFLPGRTNGRLDRVWRVTRSDFYALSLIPPSKHFSFLPTFFSIGSQSSAKREKSPSPERHSWGTPVPNTMGAFRLFAICHPFLRLVRLVSRHFLGEQLLPRGKLPEGTFRKTGSEESINNHPQGFTTLPLLHTPSPLHSSPSWISR